MQRRARGCTHTCGGPGCINRSMGPGGDEAAQPWADHSWGLPSALDARVLDGHC